MTDKRSDRRSGNARLKALDKAYAMIEFAPDGTILDANEVFLTVMGYARGDVIGHHHSMFVKSEEAASRDYAAFWESLRSGEFQSAEFRRQARGGREVWIQATYNPVFDRQGRVERILKLATDVTERRLHRFDFESQINAINASQCVIEFSLEGNVLKANENFLKFMGYKADEIVGIHHSRFCSKEMVASEAYTAFWAKLRTGAFQAGEYQRFNKAGQEVWLQASYNPVFDLGGRPIKILKVATDMTAYILRRKKREAAQASIYEGLETVAAAVAQSNGQASSAAGDAGGTADNVQAVAAGAEELAASFGEIMRSASEALEIARSAV